MAAPPAFDLQSHSTHSDGSLEPADVVRTAAAAGVELLALSDHDTVSGVAEAAAAGREAGVRVVPAVELSAVAGGDEDLHILGYELDPADPVLAARLEDSRADRGRRAEVMTGKLRELGFVVDADALDARARAGRPIGRPHLAEAVLDHPGNAERLAREGRSNMDAFFAAYLLPGTPGYEPRRRPTVPEAIGWIHDAGGLAIWAHPFWNLDDDAEVVGDLDAFRADGLDGVEAFYITHTGAQTLLLADAAAERDLLTTGSADFHGPAHGRFHAFRAFDLHGREPNLGRIGR